VLNRQKPEYSPFYIAAAKPRHSRARGFAFKTYRCVRFAECWFRATQSHRKHTSGSSPNCHCVSFRPPTPAPVPYFAHPHALIDRPNLRIRAIVACACFLGLVCIATPRLRARSRSLRRKLDRIRPDRVNWHPKGSRGLLRRLTSRFKPANNCRNHPIEKFVGNEVLQGAVHMATR
jgi:hypothetical protein